MPPAEAEGIGGGREPGERRGRLGPSATDARSRVRAERRQLSSLETPRLLEREAMLDELSLHFRERSAVGPFLIEGDPGFGKTALVNAACQRAADEGLLVLRARGNPLEVTLRFGLLRQLLEAARPLDGGRADAGMLSLLDGAANEPAASETGGTTRLGDELWRQRLLSRLAAEQPVLVAIDDLHWGDEPSLRMLHYFVRRIEAGRVWFIGSTIPRTPSGLGIVDGIMEEPSARVFRLRPLDLGSVRLFVRQCLGELETEAVVRSCWNATGGNPRLLRELVYAIRSKVLQPAVLADDMGAVVLPAVARSVDERLQRVSDEAQRVLEAVAVLGDEAELREVAAVAQVDVPAASAAADALAVVQLLRPGRPLGFRYRLERAAVRGQLGPARLARGHARAARLLDELGAPPAQVAEHLLLVEPANEHWVAFRLEQAGQSLVEEGRPDLALRCFTRALREPPHDHQHPRLVAALAATEASMGMPSALRHAREAMDLGVDIAEAVDVVVRYAEAMVGDPYPDGPGGFFAAMRDRMGEVPTGLRLPLEVARASLSLPGAELLDAAAGLRQELRGGQGSKAVWERLAMGHLALVAACSCVGVAAEEVAHMAETALGAFDLRMGNHIWVQSICRALVALIRAGRWEQADQRVSRAQEAAVQDDVASAVAAFSTVRALSSLQRGALFEAEAACRKALEALPVHSWAPARVATALLAGSLLEQGKTSAAEDVLQRALAVKAPGTLAEVACLEQRGRVRLAQGQLAAAVDDLTRAGRWAEERNLLNPITPSWRTAASTGLRGLGRTADAQRLAEEELAWARSFGAAWAQGAALRAVAGVSEERARVDLLTEANEVLESSGADLERARCSVDLGIALRARGWTTAAQQHLRAGADVAFRLGAAPLANRAARELRATGARPRRLALTGPESLTPAERRVAELAASGVKNVRIAALLFVSERTVQGHLSRVYRKVGVSSREQLRESLGPTSFAWDDNSDEGSPGGSSTP